ncbi:hypothetical protein C2W62_39380 [Candidatus Entotheonella serta]|nr:hypothetical protein C2W62_39380 [Candidatus Entotheonella serta]
MASKLSTHKVLRRKRSNVYFVKCDKKKKAYDIVIEGVSLVNNYRTQFNKIIRQESYEALVKKLKLKIEQEEAAQ